MRYGCIALLRTGLVGMMVTARIALGADSQFDIDGTHTTKEITTTTKESEITRFTFVSPVHAAEDRSYHVQAVVQFLHGGKATGEALPQDFECEGLVWTTPRFDCSNSHIFWGTIFMLRDQQTTGDWVFPYNSYTWLTKFTGRPCGGSGGAPDYWEFYAQQYTMAVTMSVDSNNDGPINDDDIPDKRNPPGVIFTVNNGDVNEDGIPDMEQVALTRAFTEMRVQLHGQIEPEDLMLRFLYQGATAGSMPEGTDPAIRIWKTNGTYPNRSHSDYLEPELWYHVDEQLGFVGPISEQTFFMEGVKLGSQTITVELAYNNQTSAVNFQPGQQDAVAVDEVEVTAVKVEIGVHPSDAPITAELERDDERFQFATVKGEGNVALQAIISPTLQEDFHHLVSWTGAVEHPLDPTIATVSRGVSTRHDVSVHVGESACSHADVWVVWADITLNTTGPTPEDSSVCLSDPPFQPQPIHYGASGVVYDEVADNYFFQNGILIQATITPSGFGNRNDQVEYRFIRTMERNAWVKDPTWRFFGGGYREPGTPDGPHVLEQDRIPSASDHIYNIDGPGVYGITGLQYERVHRANFDQHVEIKLLTQDWRRCSNVQQWHSTVWAIRRGNPHNDWVRKQSENSIGSGHIEVGTGTTPPSL